MEITFYKLVTPYTSFRISDSIKAVEICGIFFVFQSKGVLVCPVYYGIAPSFGTSVIPTPAPKINQNRIGGSSMGINWSPIPPVRQIANPIRIQFN